MHAAKKYYIVPSSPILATLMMEALHSPETSVLTRGTQRNIPDDDILHSHATKTSYLAQLPFCLHELFLESRWEDKF
jgi:hypothetical protein